MAPYNAEIPLTTIDDVLVKPVNGQQGNISSCCVSGEQQDVQKPDVAKQQARSMRTAAQKILRVLLYTRLRQCSDQTAQHSNNVH